MTWKESGSERLKAGDTTKASFTPGRWKVDDTRVDPE